MKNIRKEKRKRQPQYEKKVKLDMSFDEALKTIVKTNPSKIQK